MSVHQSHITILSLQSILQVRGENYECKFGTKSTIKVIRYFGYQAEQTINVFVRSLILSTFSVIQTEDLEPRHS